MIRRIVVNDNLWALLQAMAQDSNQSASALARHILEQAVRQAFISHQEEQKKLWKARTESLAYTPLAGQASMPLSPDSRANSRRADGSPSDSTTTPETRS